MKIIKNGIENNSSESTQNTNQNLHSWLLRNATTPKEWEGDIREEVTLLQGPDWLPRTKDSIRSNRQNIWHEWVWTEVMLSHSRLFPLILHKTWRVFLTAKKRTEQDVIPASDWGAVPISLQCKETNYLQRRCGVEDGLLRLP